MNQSTSMHDNTRGSWLGRLLSYSLLAMFVLVGTVAVARAVSLGLGDLSSPGVGLWPFLLSICLLTMCLVYAVALFGGNEKFLFPIPKGFNYAILVGIATLVVGLLLPVTGYLPALTALGFVVCWWVGGYSWIKSLLIAVIAASSVFAVFVFGLNIRMPLFP